jgi:hypothetical protein
VHLVRQPECVQGVDIDTTIVWAFSPSAKLVSEYVRYNSDQMQVECETVISGL